MNFFLFPCFLALLLCVVSLTSHLWSQAFITVIKGGHSSPHLMTDGLLSVPLFAVSVVIIQFLQRPCLEYTGCVFQGNQKRLLVPFLPFIIALHSYGCLVFLGNLFLCDGA